MLCVALHSQRFHHPVLVESDRTRLQTQHAGTPSSTSFRQQLQNFCLSLGDSFLLGAGFLLVQKEVHGLSRKQ
jgi:hypothetical protein